MGGFLIVNPRSGDGRRATDELVAEARSRGIEVHVLEPRDDAEALRALGVLMPPEA